MSFVLINSMCSQEKVVRLDQNVYTALDNTIGITKKSIIRDVKVFKDYVYILTKRHGLFKYSYKDDYLQSLHYDIINKNYNSPSKIKLVVDNHLNTIWCLLGNGFLVNCLNGESVFLDSGWNDLKIVDLISVKNKFYLITRKKGVIVFEKDGFYRINKYPYKLDKDNRFTVYYSAKLSTNSILLASRTELYRFNFKKSTIQKIRFMESSRRSKIIIHSISTKGKVAFIASRNKLYMIHAKNEKSTFSGTPLDVGMNRISVVYRDKNSNHWIGGDSLFYSTDSIRLNLNNTSLYQSNMATVIEEDRLNNKVYVGTAGSGIYIFDQLYNQENIKNVEKIEKRKSHLNEESRRIIDIKKLSVDNKELNKLASEIYFNPDDSLVKPQSMIVISDIYDKIKAIIKDNDKVVIQVIGHASRDINGEEKIIYLLSTGRARQVRKILIDMGIPSKFLSATGVGYSRPNPNQIADPYHESHRRVTFTVE